MKSSSSRPYLPRKIRQPQMQTSYLEGAQQLSIVIPALNESANIVRTLMALQPLRQGGHEVILVDGGSTDDTVALAEGLVDQVLTGVRGRGRQMNLGARHAWGDTLLFLHADTFIPYDLIPQISHALASHQWGFFRVRLSGRHPVLRMVAWLMNLRSCLSGIGTGDQALFVTKRLFQASGGYADIPLMEDIELCKRLKSTGRPACIRSPVTTSSRRWEENGIVKTVWLMWRLRWAYFFGADPAELVKRYYPSS
jgi:rSAM/selenodomain-associated transferase 2